MLMIISLMVCRTGFNQFFVYLSLKLKKNNYFFYLSVINEIIADKIESAQMTGRRNQFFLHGLVFTCLHAQRRDLADLVIEVESFAYHIFFI